MGEYWRDLQTGFLYNGWLDKQIGGADHFYYAIDPLSQVSRRGDFVRPNQQYPIFQGTLSGNIRPGMVVPGDGGQLRTGYMGQVQFAPSPGEKMPETFDVWWEHA